MAGGVKLADTEAFIEGVIVVGPEEGREGGKEGGREKERRALDTKI